MWGGYVDRGSCCRQRLECEEIGRCKKPGKGKKLGYLRERERVRDVRRKMMEMLDEEGDGDVRRRWERKNLGDVRREKEIGKCFFFGFFLSPYFFYLTICLWTQVHVFACDNVRISKIIASIIVICIFTLLWYMIQIVFIFYKDFFCVCVSLSSCLSCEWRHWEIPMPNSICLHFFRGGGGDF